QGLDERADPVRDLWLVRSSESKQVDGVDVKVRRQHGNGEPPRADVGAEAVDQHHRRPGTGLEIVQPMAGDLNLLVRDRWRLRRQRDRYDTGGERQRDSSQDFQGFTRELALSFVVRRYRSSSGTFVRRRA